MRQLPLLFSLLFLFACGCETDIVTGEEAGPISPDTETTDPGTNNSSFSSLETSTLTAVNRVRAAGCRCGNTQMPPVPALRLDATLSAAARTHSADQARRRKMSHQGSDGSTVGDRVTRAGFRWRSVGENVAWNYQNVDHVMEGWLNSEGHCKNIMSANFSLLGMAEEDLYWTQVFAR